MTVSDPSKDKRRKTSPWCLVIRHTLTRPDGTVVLNEKTGLPVLDRRRRFFGTKDLANAAKKKMETEHAVTGDGDFLWNRDAALEYTRAKAIVRNVPLDLLAKFYRLHHPLEEKPKLPELVTRFLEDRENKGASTRYYSDLKSRLGTFLKKFSDRYPETITRQGLIDYLNGAAANTRTRKNHKTAVSTFFAWLCEEQIILANPASNIGAGKIGKVEANDIAFLSLAEVERYLRAAERYDPKLVAHEIVQLIAGVRADDEMRQFRADYVFPKTKEVVIPKVISKTGQREVINTLEPSFWSWWEVYGPRVGFLRPANYGPRWARLRLLARETSQATADALAALPIKTLLKRPEATVALEEWPWNARRRTFCTFHRAGSR